MYYTYLKRQKDQSKKIQSIEDHFFYFYIFYFELVRFSPRFAYDVIIITTSNSVFE